MKLKQTNKNQQRRKCSANQLVVTSIAVCFSCLCTQMMMRVLHNYNVYIVIEWNRNDEKAQTHTHRIDVTDGEANVHNAKNCTV